MIDIKPGGAMSLCERCSNGEYHGLPPKGSPDWAVSTVYFWCPARQSHDGHMTMCDKFVRGVPGKFDKRGERL